MKQVNLNQNDIVVKCPKCKNNTKFKAHSMQVSQDCCEVWVECECGYDPTEDKCGYRYEDVMGGVDNGRVRMALEAWNDAISEVN